MHSTGRLIGWSAALAIMLVVAFVPSALGAGTHDEYVQEVSSICAQKNKKATSLQSKVQTVQGDRLLIYAAWYGKLLGKTNRQIAGVDRPPEDAPAIKKWVGGLRLERKLLRDFLRAVGQGNFQPALRTLKRFGRVERATRQKADNLELTACTVKSEIV